MKIAVSACLLGHAVRFDAGHKRHDFVADVLKDYVDFVEFCPEHLAFSTPRPSMRLVERGKGVRVELNSNGKDVTPALTEQAQTVCDSLVGVGGIIFKSRSPSCGLHSAKIYNGDGAPLGKTHGVLARLCRERWPLLPMEEEGRLQDPWLRENFMMQLFAYAAFEQFKSEATAAGLVDFHRRYKFLLQSKDERLYREMGRLVGDVRSALPAYEQYFKQAIGTKSSIGKTRNILEHMAGFVKNVLSEEEKRLLHEQIGEFCEQIIPLIVPLSTLRVFATRHEVRYLLDQVFLEPYPAKLGLRSDVRSCR
jgi:uncharacterized protein YbbK (DUF523 family)/uncharacterized protein YbgA (DUF1722 family)